jgi:hypothetical protein
VTRLKKTGNSRELKGAILTIYEHCKYETYAETVVLHLGYVTYQYQNM